MKEKKNKFGQKEITLILILLILLVVGFFAVQKARDNLSHSVSDGSLNTSNINSERVNYIGYASAQACKTPTGLLTQLGFEFRKHYPIAEEKTLADKNKPSEGSIKTSGATYPLVLDEEGSVVGNAQIAWLFKLISLDKATTTSLVNTEATITYKANGKNFTSPSFVIDSGACDI